MKQELNAKVLDIELVIIAIIQGVALTFLTENAKEPIGNFCQTLSPNYKGKLICPDVLHREF